jgi:hypothetical protein
MKVWVLTESSCTCCGSIFAIYSTEEKANEAEAKSTSRYKEVDWYIVDED